MAKQKIDPIWYIIDELRVNGSTLKKQAILEKNKDNTLLKEVFRLTENSLLNFYIRVDSNPAKVREKDGPGILTLELLKEIEQTLRGRKKTGNAAHQYIQGVLDNLCFTSQSVLIKIINRDLECNVGTSICNKVWKDLIPEYACMLAGKFDEKAIERFTKLEAKGAFIVQTKMDGGRVNVQVSEFGEVTLFSRNGKELLTHGVFDSLFEKFPGMVFDGEMLVRSSSGVMSRKEGNGFFNKAVRGTISKEEVEKMSIALWDVIDLTDFLHGHSSLPYRTRLQDLSEIVKKIKNTKVFLVNGKTVSSLDEVQEFYQEMLAEDEEGAILKLANMPWEDRRSKSMVKLKEERDADLICVGVEEHSKEPGWVGSLLCETRDGKVKTGVGSGLDEEGRQRPWKDYIGKVIKLKYNAIITKKNSTELSLFLPIFQEIRTDKDVANSYEELV